LNFPINVKQNGIDVHDWRIRVMERGEEKDRT